MSNATILEVVEFKLSAEADVQVFLRESKKLEEGFLKKCVGFVNRETFQDNAGNWMDTVHWETMKDAEKAASEVESSHVCHEFMQMIDPQSIKMRHFTRV